MRMASGSQNVFRGVEKRHEGNHEAKAVKSDLIYVSIYYIYLSSAHISEYES